MQAHWVAFGPPVYIPVAGYFGLAKGYKKEATRGTLDELAELFAGSGGVIQ